MKIIGIVSLEMHFTGADIIRYTDQSFADVRHEFEKALGGHWPGFEQEDLTDPEDGEATFILYFRNQEMNRWHEEEGFTLNENGESCVMLCGGPRRNHLRPVHFPEYTQPGEITTAAGDAVVFFKTVYEITLVTPELPDDDPFSGKILAMLDGALRTLCEIPAAMD